MIESRFRLFAPALLLVILLLVSPWAMAQTAKELDTRLANGRALIDQGKYDLAMTELLPVFQANLNYKDTPLALYLYSVAALKQKKYKEANERIVQLVQQFPSWPNMADAKFIGANIAFEQREYQKALMVLREITDPALATDIAAMKQTYLSRINNKTLLTSFFQQYPEDREVAVVLADKLMGGWYTEKDKSLLEGIVTRFNLDRSKYTPKPAGAKKGQYNVAVLLPFNLGNPDEKALRKNQFITDLYAGILMARDSLAKQNIQINLFAYEAPADTNKVKSLLMQPEMASMDLIIGPVYKSANKIISRFTQLYQINAINPLSEDISLLKRNPYLYLFRASITTQARRSADYAYDNFPQKTAVVVYSNSEDHITFAHAYKAQFEKRGGKVRAMKSVSPTSTGAGIFTGVDFSTLGHLVVAANNTSLAYNTISTLERLNRRVPLITYASWLEMTQFSIKQLDDQEIYFLHPTFVDASMESVQAFKKDYAERFNIPPSEYVHTGFDLMYYFGNILARHGSRFNTSLESEGAVSGVFFQGIGYGSEHDNQYVPLLKLDNLQLNVVNPVLK